jgi:hypothetical protein
MKNTVMSNLKVFYGKEYLFDLEYTHIDIKDKHMIVYELIEEQKTLKAIIPSEYLVVFINK